MATHTRTFRVFVSSTFSDLRGERGALAERVFPRLRGLCREHEARFHAVDLRWGVSEEASLDQRAMLICLEELHRCRRISPRPNFVVLLGDRYGWRPLPYAIPGNEFAEIEKRCPASYRALIAEWYRRDDNAVVSRGGVAYPEHVLRARTGEYEKDERWCMVERDLLTALIESTADMQLSTRARLKYGTSATEQEIEHGALAVADAREHVHCYHRRIANFDQLVSEASTSVAGRDFADFDGTGHLDDGARKNLLDLRSRLVDTLGNQFHEYEARWSKGRVTQDHIDGLCEDVYRDLKSIIEAETERLESSGAVVREQALHEEFARDRTATFVGRVAILDRIRRYAADGTPHPLLLYGPAGSGKSSVMAAAAREAPPQSTVIQRFVGTTPQSSDGGALLRGLWRQISEAYGDQTTVPGDETELIGSFGQRLALARPDKPLILFIDALDQLPASDPAVPLSWLPGELPPHVRVVLSILSDAPPQQFHARLPADAVVRLEPMAPAEGSELLDQWLAGAQRTLQPSQRRQVLDAFAANGLPLFLKVAFEEARRWQSFTPPDQTVLVDSVPGVLGNLLERLEKDHGPLLVERSIGLLGASRAGLAEDELLDVLSGETDVLAEFRTRSAKSPDLGPHPRLPVIVWSRLFFDLEPYLSERAAEGTTVMSFYHGQLASAVGTRYLSRAGVRLARHGGLAAYFGAQELAIPHAGGTGYNRRALYELAYEQTLAEDWGALESVLTSIDFVEAKSRAGMVFDLMGDYVRASSAWPGQEGEHSRDQRGQRYTPLERIRTWDHFVSNNIDALASGHGPAFQVAYNSADSGPVAEEIEEWLRRSHGPAAFWLRRTNRPPFLLRPTCLKTLNGHQLAVTAVAMTPDGRRAVSGSTDLSVRVWDLETGRCLVLKGHTDDVTAVAMTPDGRRVVSGSRDKTLRIWDIESGQSRILDEPAYEQRGINAVAMTLDGRRVVFGGEHKSLTIGDLEAGRACPLKGQAENGIVAIAVTEDGRHAVCGSIGGSLRVRDLETGVSRVLAGHEGPIVAVAVTPGGRRVVTASHDRTLRVWDLEKGNSRTLEGHDDQVSAVAMTPDGRRAVSAGWDRTLRIWDLDTGTFRVLDKQAEGITALAITADGRRALSGSEDESLRLWDLESDDSQVLEGHVGSVSALAVSPDRRQVISGSEDATLRVWDLDSGRSRVLKGHTKGVLSVAVTPDGRRAVSGSWDKALHVWDLESGRCRLFEGHGESARKVAVTPDGRRAISGSNDRTLRVWDLDSGRSRVLEGHTNVINSIAVTPDGRCVVSGAGDKTLRIWDLETGSSRCFDRRAYVQMSVAITPDGRLLVDGKVTPNGRHLVSAKETPYVVDLETGRSRAMAAAGRQDDSEVRGKTLRIWDLRTGRGVAICREPSNVVMTPDGRFVVTAGALWDRTIRVWDLETGRNIATHESAAGLDSLAQRFPLLAGGTETGRVEFLRLEMTGHDSPPLLPGPRIATPTRLWLGEPGFAGGRWDDSLSAFCDACGRRFPVPAAIIDAIANTTLSAGIGPDEPPCATLPREAWDQEHLRDDCPNCHETLRFNPFIVDNRNRWPEKSGPLP